MSTLSNGRVRSIDRFRGLCMLFVVFQFVMGAMGGTFESWAPLLEHEEDGFQLLAGFSIADLFAPAFIFIIGMTICRSFASREAKVGTGRAYFQLAVRFLSLIGLGGVCNAIEDGWVEMLSGEPFSELGLNMRILMIAAVLAAVLILFTLISGCFKSGKVNAVASDVLHYYLAALGVAVLFFIAASAGGRTGIKFDDTIEKDLFGKYIWDTLENIGLAGLVALPFIRMNKWGKLAVTLSTFAFVGVFVQFGGYPMVRLLVEGAPFSCICWAGILLLGSFFMDLRDDKPKYWAFAGAFIVIPALLAKFCGVITSKRGCTPAYALITAGVAAVIFGVLYLFENWDPKFKPITWWGGSCIFTYTLNYLISLIIGFIFDAKELTVGIPVGLGLTAAVTVVLTLIHWALFAKDKHVRL